MILNLSPEGCAAAITRMSTAENTPSLSLGCRMSLLCEDPSWGVRWGREVRHTGVIGRRAGVPSVVLSAA